MDFTFRPDGALDEIARPLLQTLDPYGVGGFRAGSGYVVVTAEMASPGQGRNVCGTVTDEDD